ncbi:hypothetical protein CPLU01_00917 [Colletotrichum plurivorum]|uniref:Uncharacterized protein n=1 Tax=Colletotrichum plurivorum TaxID=2175906 RepID=A0A8H6U5I4_9PEZI|nr:hypothetical protein CPLU01_00917 [Colletotrichum plurivorum]
MEAKTRAPHQRQDRRDQQARCHSTAQAPAPQPPPPPTCPARSESDVHYDPLRRLRLGRRVHFQETRPQSGKTVQFAVWQVEKNDYTVSVTVAAAFEKLAQQTAEATSSTAEAGPAASGSEPT